jgi:cell division protein FtsB
LAVVLSLVLSESFRNTFSRRQAILRDQEELQRLTVEADHLHEKISRLQSDPKSYEHLVRQELGYLRPGEKEVRFLKK